MVVKYEVILATYNGSFYIKEQLDSIASQLISPDRILISDDCSTDATLSIIHDWSNSSSVPVEVLPPLPSRIGCRSNFERLLDHTILDYVMISDQDDIWESTKAYLLFDQMSKLESSLPPSFPILIHSDLVVVDRNKNLISPSFFKYQRLDPKKTDFLSIGIQNVVTGCTCLVNRSSIQASLPFPREAILHDWWLALVVSHIGNISCISTPCMFYRQHSRNVIGAQGYWTLLLRRFLSFRLLFKPAEFVARPIYQMQACHHRYASSNDTRTSHINHLTSIRRSRRLYAAFRLKLSKHGLLRTIFFYLCLFFWTPLPSTDNLY